MVVARTSIEELDDTPRYQWDLLRHWAIVWALQPTPSSLYQQHRVQL